MPFKSKAQQRLFFAAANKKGGIKGLSQEAAQKFIEDARGTNMSDLPEKTKDKFKKLKKAMGTSK